MCGNSALLSALNPPKPHHRRCRQRRQRRRHPRRREPHELSGIPTGGAMRTSLFLLLTLPIFVCIYMLALNKQLLKLCRHKSRHTNYRLRFNTSPLARALLAVTCACRRTDRPCCASMRDLYTYRSGASHPSSACGATCRRSCVNEYAQARAFVRACSLPEHRVTRECGTRFSTHL